MNDDLVQPDLEDEIGVRRNDEPANARLIGCLAKLRVVRQQIEQ